MVLLLLQGRCSCSCLRCSLGKPRRRRASHAQTFGTQGWPLAAGFSPRPEVVRLTQQAWLQPTNWAVREADRQPIITYKVNLVTLIHNRLGVLEPAGILECCRN